MAKQPVSYTFTVNGVERTVTEKKPLLRYLRDDLHIHSAKDGCSEGACGTCTILVDDHAVKACVLTTELAAGRDIVTVEGLPKAEQEAFVYAFGAVGAVQCGFCIPGMVMAGAGLIHHVPNPTEDQIKEAIKGNVCRCTGYKKIIEGIELAAAILRGEKQIDPELERGDRYGVGERAFRVDVRRKVLGYGKYPDDIDETDFPDLAYASAVRSKYPRARVVKIDADKARALPGVLAILTAADVPVNAVGHLIYDWDVMIAEGDITRCVGDAIALVVAEDMATCERAKKLVKITYEELEPVRSIDEARAEDAPLLHDKFLAFGNWVELENNICQQRHVVRGDAATALANSAHVVTRSFSTPATEHAFLEPECAVAFPVQGRCQGLLDRPGRLRLPQGDRPHVRLGRHARAREVVGDHARGRRLRRQGGRLRPASGRARRDGREHRPVKCRMTRQESINFHPKRHAMEGTFTLGCDENGIFTGLDCEINFDTGAYASLCGPVLERACTHSVGPYCYQNNPTSAVTVGTRTTRRQVPSAASVCAKASSPSRCSSNLLAEQVGISPWEIRYRNDHRAGKVLPNGQIADCSTALKETLLAVKDVFDAHPGHAGIACAMKNAGVGVGLPDAGRCKIRVEDGRAVVYSATSDMARAATRSFCRMWPRPRACRCRTSSTASVPPRTRRTPVPPSGSRQTLITGEAVRGAAFLLRDAMLAVEAGDEVPVEPVAAHGDGFVVEYADGTPYQGPASAVHPADPTTSLAGARGS